MEASIDHALVDAVLGVWVLGRDLPARCLLDQRQPVGRVAIDLVGAAEDERRVRAILPRHVPAGSSVPLALTVKSVSGSRAAQSCEGCAAVWMTTAMSRP